jgi:hypothetical protein
MRVLGLDVSKDNVTCCLLTAEHCHAEPRQLYQSIPFYRIYANATGIAQLVALSADVAVLEPTGVNYMRVWATQLAAAGVQLMLVGHKELRHYRISLGLDDKDDQADSLALSMYYWTYQGKPGRFLRERDAQVAQMREVALRLHHANRVQSPMINRLRQDLAWQYPEAAKRKLESRLFWRWLAERGKSLKYDAELAASVGSGLTETTRRLAGLLEDWRNHEAILEREMREILADARFTPYRRVMATYGLGDRAQALIISQIYPLGNYLKDGKLETVLTRSKRRPDHRTRKHLSERRFAKALGVAPIREASGDSSRTKKAGSELCRTALWQWCFTRIEVRGSRPKTERMRKVCELFDQYKEQMPIKKARAKTCALAAKWLLHDLVKALGE